MAEKYIPKYLNDGQVYPIPENEPREMQMLAFCGLAEKCGAQTMFVEIFPSVDKNVQKIMIYTNEPGRFRNGNSNNDHVIRFLPTWKNLTSCTKYEVEIQYIPSHLVVLGHSGSDAYGKIEEPNRQMHIIDLADIAKKNAIIRLCTACNVEGAILWYANDNGDFTIYTNQQEKFTTEAFAKFSEWWRTLTGFTDCSVKIENIDGCLIVREEA